MTASDRDSQSHGGSQTSSTDAVVTPGTLSTTSWICQAEIIIGGQLCFPVITTVENTVIQSVQFLDIGSQLKLRPTITGDGNILMWIHPELSDGAVEEGLPSKTTTFPATAQSPHR